MFAGVGPRGAGLRLEASGLTPNEEVSNDPFPLAPMPDDKKEGLGAVVGLSPVLSRFAELKSELT